MRPCEQTHCCRGHLLDGENVRLARKGRWFRRVCKLCFAQHLRAHIIRKIRRAA